MTPYTYLTHSSKDELSPVSTPARTHASSWRIITGRRPRNHSSSPCASPRHSSPCPSPSWPFGIVPAAKNGERTSAPAGHATSPHPRKKPPRGLTRGEVDQTEEHRHHHRLHFRRVQSSNNPGSRVPRQEQWEHREVMNDHPRSPQSRPETRLCPALTRWMTGT